MKILENFKRRSGVESVFQQTKDYVLAKRRKMRIYNVIIDLIEREPAGDMY